MTITRTILVVLSGLALSTFANAEIHVPMGGALKAAVNKPQPEYSSIAKQMRVSGNVEIEVTIGTDGTVDQVKAVSGNPLLTSSATTAVKKWKFTPFQADGQPTKAVTTLSFTFKQ